MLNRIKPVAALGCLLIALAAAPASAQIEQEQLQRWLKRFPDADLNKDGTLTVEEATKYRRSVQQQRKAQNKKTTRVEPTRANVKYGPHQRNVFDLWLPEGEPKTDAGYPLFVYFHGGGFVGGDKSRFDPSPYLNAGLAVVSGNYRLVDGRETLSPTPMVDAARVIQFLRTKADDWKLDEKRICVSGSSAGAVIAMWIGYHDDLADPESDDPVTRQSTRVTCIVPMNGPTILDPHWIHTNMGGPSHVHGSFPKMFGVGIDQVDRPEIAAMIKETSPFEHVTTDDVPTLLVYGGKLEGIPLPESASTGLLIHHPYFGKVLHDKLNELGIPNEFHHGSDPRKGPGEAQVRNWLEKYLVNAAMK